MTRIISAFLGAIVAMAAGSTVMAAPGSSGSKPTSSACTTPGPSSYDHPSATGATAFSSTLNDPLQTLVVSSSDSLSLSHQLLLADTTADRFNLLPDDTQFVFDFNKAEGTAGDGGNLTAANRKIFPALVGTGMAMALGRVRPCGLNTFHIHPRSAELQLVIEGRLVTEMVPENGVVDSDGNRRVIRNEIGALQMTPFYQGSVHTQFNPDCIDAVFVASFASEDFGTGQVLDQAFTFSDDIVAASFGQTIAGEYIDAVRGGIPTSIALGVDGCLKRCGIEKQVE